MRKAGRTVVWTVLVVAHALPLAAFAESQSHTVQVTATILPRLELSVSPATGSSIAFGAIVQPDGGHVATKTVAVNLSVFSNLDRPYHVTQSLRHPLANSEGTAIPDGQFSVSASGASRGDVGRPGPVGQTATLYTSDVHGKSDAFVADYALAVTPTTAAGDFATEIVYTVTSL